MLLPIAVWGIFGFSEIYYLCDGWTILIAALTAYLMLSFGNSFLSSIRTLYVLLALPVMLCVLIMSVEGTRNFGRYVSKTGKASSRPQHHHLEYSI